MTPPYETTNNNYLMTDPISIQQEGEDGFDQYSRCR